MILGREFQILFLSTWETTFPDGSTRNPIESLCNPFVFNSAITRAQALIVSVGNPFLLLKIEKHMIEKYGIKAKCWSTYFKFCLNYETFKFHNSLNLKDGDKEAILRRLNSMIKANEQMLSQKKPPTDRKSLVVEPPAYAKPHQTDQGISEGQQSRTQPHTAGIVFMFLYRIFCWGGGGILRVKYAEKFYP